jgi:hypothetical protein
MCVDQLTEQNGLVMRHHYTKYSAAATSSETQRVAFSAAGARRALS